ncbi:MAG: ATP-dependent metallopeptidase FtsH/Yme1/Tma family protein, partial [Vogesella sp.]|nr:ATP-dependent metallopeptidase FtsH/Yme1/Tma family protein [Vogesella sp.]
MNNIGKNIAIWVIIGLVLMTVFKQFQPRETQNQLEYSQFISDVETGKVQSLTIEGNPLRGQWIRGKRTDGSSFSSFAPLDTKLVDVLIQNNVRFSAKPEEEPSMLMNIFISWFPMLLLIGVWFFFMRQMQGGGKGGAFSFGKSKARMLD